MWFFDSVLEEAAQTNVSPSPVVSTTKKDDDGSFLIIDNSIKAESLPDTAVQLFEITPVESIQEVAPVSEISFFSEEKGASESEEAAVSENSYPEVAVSENIEITPLESVTEEPLVSVQEVHIETTPEIAPVAIMEEVVQASVAPEKSDIYAPMKRAIAEYETFLSALMEDAKKEDSKIEISNAQIAEAKEIAKRAIDAAKESAKVALEKRKTIDTEMKRIEEMKNVLALQIK